MAAGMLYLRLALLWMAPVLCPGGFKGKAEAARILGIFPSPSISHQVPMQTLMKELAARGHEVTVITTDPLKEPMANYTDIDLSFSYDIFRKNFNFVANTDGNPLTFVKNIVEFMLVLSDEQLASQQIQDFLKNNPKGKFDVVFLEWLAYSSYFGLIHALGSPPIVGILSFGGLENAYNALSNPHNPAINPSPYFWFTDQMSFGERAYNTYVYLWMTHLWQTRVLPVNEQVMRKHFGSAPPPVWETEHNMSLLVLNNHWSTEYPRAYLPNVVSLAGVHIKETPDPLLKDLKQWMDGAKEGVVYFSLGSNVQSRDLPAPLRDAILRALARLPQRVLWKFEDDSLPGKPPNVRISKWLPQQSVLAHPNVRLFITQGGLQSYQESVFHAVPMLAIPFVSDQPYNAAKMHAVGVGRKLDLTAITEEIFYNEITTIIRDKGYKERILQLSAEFREHKATSMDNAVWWVEYVIRHNGAPHLRSAAQQLRWYEYLLLDVVAALLVAVAIFVSVLVAVCRAICCRRKKLENDYGAKKRQ